MTIEEKLDIINKNIKKSVDKCGINQEIVILPVSKKKSVDQIREVLKLGIKRIGENYVQELLPKYEELKDEVEEFHFIGHLQSNKVKYIIDKVFLIHSVDSVSLMKEIDKQARKTGKIQNILLEVNYASEETKTGADIKTLYEMLNCAHLYPNVKIKGLMTMPPPGIAEEELRKIYSQFKALYDEEKAKDYGENVSFDTLSMGMSGDYDIAVCYGATIVRLGTALFGQRI